MIVTLRSEEVAWKCFLGINLMQGRACKRAQKQSRDEKHPIGLHYFRTWQKWRTRKYCTTLVAKMCHATCSSCSLFFFSPHYMVINVLGAFHVCLVSVLFQVFPYTKLILYLLSFRQLRHVKIGNTANSLNKVPRHPVMLCMW